MTTSSPKTPRERSADRISIVVAVLGTVLVVVDLVWIALVATDADEPGVSWRDAAGSSGAWTVWGVAAGLVTAIAGWALVAALRHRGTHHREVDSAHRSYILACALVVVVALLTGSLPAALVAIVALAVVMLDARHGLADGVRRRAALAIERMTVPLLLTMALSLTPTVWSFAAVGSDEASGPAREAWIDDHLGWLTLTARGSALLLAVLFAVLVWTNRSAIARIAALRVQLGVFAVIVAAVAGLSLWIVPPVVVLVAALSMLAIRRDPSTELLPPVSLSGRHDPETVADGAQVRPDRP